jgi:hypothetical protein
MRVVASFVSLAALAMAAPAAAQAPWSADGTLADSDSHTEDQRRYDEHSIRLEAGQRYAITVNSEAFDPVARLYRAGESEPVAENDDGGNGLNSRIAYTPSAAGDFTLRVTAYAAEGRGAYQAAVAALPPVPPPVTSPGTEVSANGSWSLWQGRLDPTDPDVAGHRFDDYLVRFEAGRQRFISLEGDGFDALVQVMRPAERDSESPETIDQNDDAGLGFNALMAFAPEEGGDYIVRVTSFGESGGSYRLWISR